MSHDTTRRDLLKAGAAAGLGLMAAPSILAQERKNSSDKIRFAIVGCGGRGGANLASAAQFREIVALCDVDMNVRTKTMLDYPRAASFSDFRAMIDSMHKHIDAVVVSTPDHTHSVAAATAMRAGKHVYCEKPMSRTVWEARKLSGLARTQRVMTQMGNQGTASSELRKAAALLKAKSWGDVKEIHCWTDRSGGWWPQGVERPPSKVTPKHVDFDLWLGPAPSRPYADGYHPFAWRGWWDFGSGSLGDIGCHCMNLPFMAFDLRDPISILAETSGHNKDSFPSWSIVHYEFGQRGNRAPVMLHWYDGGKKPSQDLIPGQEMTPNGCIIVCEKATLFSPGEYGGGGRLVGGAPMPDVEIVESPGHFAEFALAIRGGKIPLGNFPGYAGPLAEMVVLGNLAVWANGEKVMWDARKGEAKGTTAYDALLKQNSRIGWEI